jgi:hypothetical protein
MPKKREKQIKNFFFLEESRKKRRDSKVPIAKFPNIKNPGKNRKAIEDMKADFSSKIFLAIK